jgi:hypothetical protein
MADNCFQVCLRNLGEDLKHGTADLLFGFHFGALPTVLKHVVFEVLQASKNCPSRPILTEAFSGMMVV